MKGAILVVAANHRVRYALNENMSVVQESFASQASSYAILSVGKKFVKVALRSPSTRSFQTEEPLVYFED